jgi:hypothetical protein
LRIVDTAYLSYADMRAASQSRRYWITGVKADMLFRDEQGRWWNLTEWVASQPSDTQVVDVWVQAGKADQVPVRLIAVRLPEEVVRRRRQRANREVERRPPSSGIQRCGRRPKRRAGRQPRQRARKRHKVSARKQRLQQWLLVLTNVEDTVLDAQQVVALMRLRWQMELLWKLCRAGGQNRHVEKRQAAAHLDRVVCQALGLAAGALGHHPGLLGRPAPQPVQSAASAAVDGLLAGVGHSRRGALGGGLHADV